MVTFLEWTLPISHHEVRALSSHAVDLDIEAREAAWPGEDAYNHLAGEIDWLEMSGRGKALREGRPLGRRPDHDLSPLPNRRVAPLCDRAHTGRRGRSGP